jgi:hypothetical protein
MGIEIERDGRHVRGALPLPLAGEGWGGGVSTRETPNEEKAPTRRVAPTSPRKRERCGEPVEAGAVRKRSSRFAALIHSPFPG